MTHSGYEKIEMQSLKHWVHDCDKCIYLGSFTVKEKGDEWDLFADKRSIHYDLYFCDSSIISLDGGSPTVIARYDSEGYKYLSGLLVAKNNNCPPLNQALLLANLKNLTKLYPKYLGSKQQQEINSGDLHTLNSNLPTPRSYQPIYLCGNVPRFHDPLHNIGAINTGIKRCPLKEEWYLVEWWRCRAAQSPEGSIAYTAYRANKNLDTKYYIAQLVRFKQIRIVTEILTK